MSDAARGSAPWWRDHVEATLNAFWGDHLERTGNPLDIGMAFYLDGVRAKPSVVAARAGQARRLTVFVHGLGATEWCWTANAQVHWGQPEVTFGTRLADDLGHAPVYVRYNTGRSVVANAGALSDALQALVEAFPDDVTPEIALVGHSMGGLVARRAADSARQRGAAWRNALTHVVTIGSPIHGAPLAKAAELGSRALLTLGMGAAIAGHVLDRRSQGVRDLYSGERHDPVVLDDVESHAIASTITNDSGHPVGWLVGDLMVRVPSALADGESTSLVAGLDHLGIANHPAIYDALLDALRSTCD